MAPRQKIAKSASSDIAKILGVKKKKNVLSIQEKVRVLDLLKEKKSLRQIADMTGASKSQISRIKNNEEGIKLLSSENVFRPYAKRLKDESKHPEIDKAVYEWFTLLRNRPKPISLSRLHIQSRARRECDLRGIKDFKGSDGWFRNWRRRFGIGPSLRLYGEAGDVNIAEMEPIMTEFRAKIEKFHPNNIFNMDETGLYFKQLPIKSYISVEESRSTVRGT